MNVTFRLPEFLRDEGGRSCGDAEVGATGATVAEALGDLFRRRPGARERVLDARGAVFPYVLLFRNGEELPRTSAMSVGLGEGDVIEIVAGAEGG